MTSSNNAATVSLLPAVRGDVERIAAITANSLDATPASQFLFKPSVYRTGRRDAAMTAYFIWRTEAALDDPTAEVIKAVDPKSGDILGFATWQFTETVDPFSTEPANDGVKIPDRNRGGGGGGGGGGGIAEPAAIVEDVNMDLMRDYFTSTGHNQVQIANVTRGASTAYLWHLYVDPTIPQSGVGTLLMKWGLERVDAKGIASSVVSTPNAKDFYTKFGFAEISHVDLDIAKIRGEFMGFGLWRQYGMLRAAVPANLN